MNTPHTPGPWTVAPAFEGQRNRYRVTAKSPHVPGKMQTICELNGPWDEENYASNAQLIASAPTLLSQRNELREALQAITDKYADVLGVPMGSVPAAWETRARAILAHARAALANAKD